MEYPYTVEISTEHDDSDITDWLVSNDIVAHRDYKAIRLTHIDIYMIYFKDAKKAMLTKLRWTGVNS